MGGKNAAFPAPPHYIELYLHERLLHTIGFYVRSLFYPGRPKHRPTPSRSSHGVPSPQCLLLKVTQSKLGQSSQVKQKRRGPIAVETGLCTVCLLCLYPPVPSSLHSLSCLSPLTSPSPQHTHTHTLTTTKNSPAVARACNAAQVRATQISGEATGRRD